MIDLVKVHNALLAASLPVVSVRNEEGVAVPVYTRELTAGEQSTATSILSSSQVQVRVPRDLRLIVNDLDALSNPNKLAIWNFINGGTPPRWTLSNQGEVWAILRLSESGALSSTVQTLMRLTAVAMYCRNEDPFFLVNPSFATTVNVPGDVAV
jgi:hypothetical protein